MNLTIHTWNVNSVRAREEQVSLWLDKVQPDIFVFQETKVNDSLFPISFFEEKGYGVIFNGQKSYNGVAIGYKKSIAVKLADIIKDNPFFEDEQARVISASLEFSKDFVMRLINIYVPNGSSIGSSKYQYKLDFLDALKELLETELRTHKNICLAGDFNIAPCDIDVHDPVLWHEKILCTTVERERFQNMLNLNFIDTFRLQNPNKKLFSWWDYRQGAFRRDLGLRIDHILVTKNLAENIKESGIMKEIRKNPKASDHAPCWVEISI